MGRLSRLAPPISSPPGCHLGGGTMPQPRVPKNGTHRSPPERVADGSRQGLTFTRLQDIPIEDAPHEKTVFEAGDFERKLSPSRGPEVVVVSDDARNARIVEVYRRCFEEAEENDWLKVVRDFFAHFPHLAFDAAWLRPLLHESVTEIDRKEILIAMANGLRAAARRSERSAAQESYRIAGARIAMRTIHNQLSRWNDGLQRAINTPAEVQLASAKKTGELANIYRLGASEARRLQKMLGAGQCYKAAGLVTAKAFRVRERDLQDRAV